MWGAERGGGEEQEEGEEGEEEERSGGSDTDSEIMRLRERKEELEKARRLD